VLGRENRELRRANEIPRKASAFFAAAELVSAPKEDCTEAWSYPQGLDSLGPVI
jgi:hypothetical protein